MNASEITHGLVIDTPWIEKILEGDKVWEMRSQNTNRRGQIALIQKGTKRIFGIANLYESQGPLCVEELAEACDCHCIPSPIYESDEYKWNYAWKLKDVKVLSKPVSYIHKSGAVIWVELDSDSKEALNEQLAFTAIDSENDMYDTVVNQLKETTTHELARAKSPIVNEDAIYKSSGQVPYAKDGTHFCPVFCRNSNGYTVGEKGDERKFLSYQEALQYLKTMPKAKWRRPNPNGNWGIVTAVDWKAVS